MSQLMIIVPDTFHEELKEFAKKKGVSIKNCVMRGVSALINEGGRATNPRFVFDAIVDHTKLPPEKIAERLEFDSAQTAKFLDVCFGFLEPKPALIAFMKTKLGYNPEDVDFFSKTGR